MVRPRVCRLAAPLLLALVTGLASPSAAQAPVFTIERPVTDHARVLSLAESDAIATRLIAYRDATGVQLAVVLVSTLGGAPIDDYAQDLFDRWGGGTQGRNDGALLVLAIGDRQSRLHLGYGLEGHISDSRANGMLAALRPALREGAYGKAVMQLIDLVWAATDDIAPTGPIRVPWPRQQLWVLFFLVLALVLTPLTWYFIAPERARATRRARAPHMAAAAPRTASQWRAARRAAVEAAHAARKAVTTPAVRTRMWIAYICLLGVAPLALGAVTAGAVGSFLAYPLVWLTGCAVAGYGILVWEQRRIGRWFWSPIAALLTAPLFTPTPNGRVDAADEIAGFCMVTLITVSIVSAFFLNNNEPRSGSSGYSGGSSSRSSSSRSSSSRSSSSRSWSGGGGRSGGGGASSSW